MFLELRLDQREGERRSDERDVLAQPEQIRNSADVVFMAVSEHDAEHVIQSVSDRREIGKDQVDARLVLLGEEHAAVDDKNLAVDLVRGHVATDLAEAADRDYAKSSWLKFGGLVNRGRHAVLSSYLVVPATLGSAPPAAALRSGRKLVR